MEKPDFYLLDVRGLCVCFYFWEVYNLYQRIRPWAKLRIKTPKFDDGDILRAITFNRGYPSYYDTTIIVRYPGARCQFI